MRLKRSIAISACILLALVAITTAASALTVTSISPNTAARGTTITATVTGTGFLSGAEIMIYGGGTTVYATGETLLSTTQVRCTLNIPSNAYLGSYAVYARNPGMTSWVYKTGAFVVRAAAADLGSYGIAVNTGVNSRTFPFWWAVKNWGTGPAGAFVVRFYLSADSTITASDYYFAQRSFSGLGAGASSPWTSDMASVSTSVPGGSYYVGMIVDAANQVPETSETNNRGIAMNKVTIPPNAKADLKPWVFWVAGGINSRNFVYQNAVKNVGTGAAGAFITRFYLSADTTYSTSDTYLGGRSYSGLGAGATAPTVSTSISVPTTVPAGTYYVLMLVDPMNTVPETIETNNVAATYYKVTIPSAGLPDLKPWVYYVTNGINSRNFVYQNAVKNVGTGAAGPFITRFYLSADATYSTSDTYLGGRSYSGLGAGVAAPTQSVSISVPASVPAGTYHVLMIVDAAFQVPESNENNQVAATYYKVTIPPAGKPDLASYVFDATKPSTLLTRTVIITNAVRNSGTAPAGAFTVRFYASKNNIISSTDSYLGSRTYSGLAAGQIGSTQTLTFTVPSGGTWYIGAIIDYYGSVSESNEGNNVVYDSSPLTYFSLTPINP